MPLPDNDIRQRFLFDHSDIRGEILSLQSSYQAVLSQTDYPPAIACLVGEFMAGVSLLSATLKFDGIISLQASGTGPLSMIMADCTRHHDIRAIAHYRNSLFEDTASPLNQVPCRLSELLGNNATLAVTIDPAKGERYQGIIPIEVDTLSECLSDYFLQSEQLPTRIWLQANSQRAAGLLLQALPTDLQSPEEKQLHWEHLNHITQTLTATEQLELSHGELLHRLYHEETLRLFTPSEVRFACSCSRARTENMLAGFGRRQVMTMLEESSPIEVSCQFCHQLYTFNNHDIEKLLGQLTPTLH